MLFKLHIIRCFILVWVIHLVNMRERIDLKIMFAVKAFI